MTSSRNRRLLTPVIENITENNNYYDDNNDRSSDRDDRDFASTDDFNDNSDGGFDDSDWS